MIVKERYKVTFSVGKMYYSDGLIGVMSVLLKKYFVQAESKYFFSC